MKLCKENLLLYAVTDGSEKSSAELCKRVGAAIAGGVTMVQLREKGRTGDELLERARCLKSLCGEHKIPFIIDDDANFAALVDADGVHVGQSDMTAKEARNVIGDEKILGVSVQNVEQAREAVRSGADYLGVGAVFPTGSKADADSVSLDELRRICEAVDIPVVAIGGVDIHNVEKTASSGACGAAVISAIFSAEDIEKAARSLREVCENVFWGGSANE